MFFADNDLLVAWAAAQVLPEVPSERLRALASPVRPTALVFSATLIPLIQAFFDFGFSYIRACFMDGGLFNGITYDVSASRDGLLWPVRFWHRTLRPLLLRWCLVID